MSELNLGSNMSIKFPDGDDKIMHFEITISPNEGMYKCVPTHITLRIYANMRRCFDSCSIIVQSVTY